jgi:hypothetical protein
VYLVDPPMVGHPTRIRTSNPTIELPDPRCDDGRLRTIPVPIQTWSVTARPAGSTANVTPRGVEAELVADRSGSWQVVYVACPHVPACARMCDPETRVKTLHKMTPARLVLSV